MLSAFSSFYAATNYDKLSEPPWPSKRLFDRCAAGGTRLRLGTDVMPARLTLHQGHRTCPRQPPTAPVTAPGPPAPAGSQENGRDQEGSPYPCVLSHHYPFRRLLRTPVAPELGNPIRIFRARRAPADVTPHIDLQLNAHANLMAELQLWRDLAKVGADGISGHLFEIFHVSIRLP